MPAKNPRIALNLSDQSIKGQMQALAAEHRRTLSGEIEMALIAWIKKHQQETNQ